MNNLTKLKTYLDKCIAGGKQKKSRFRITRRSYNDKLNQHEFSIMYSYKNADDLPVSPATPSTRKHARSLYDEIIDAKKIRFSKDHSEK